MTRVGDTIEVSNSEIQAFTDCPRKWWLSYHRGLRPVKEKVTGPLSIGSRVHRCLEEGYSSPGREEALFKVFVDSINEDYPKAQELDVVDQFEKDCELVLVMLEGFVDWAAEEGLDSGWEVVRSEGVMRSPALRVETEDVVLKGKLDQVVRREMDDSLWMRDWKTTDYKQPVMLAFGPQLKMYILLLQLTEQMAQVTGGQFVFLRKVKRTAKAEPPFYMVEPQYVSPTEMESFWTSTLANVKRLVQAVHLIEEGRSHLEVAPARPTADCSWRCPFYPICPMFDDGSNVEGYLAAAYTVGDPYSYYDETDKNEETT